MKIIVRRKPLFYTCKIITPRRLTLSSFFLSFQDEYRYHKQSIRNPLRIFFNFFTICLAHVCEVKPFDFLLAEECNELELMRFYVHYI